MRTTTGTLADLTTALNEAITELAAPVSPATGTLASATSQLNALLSWYMSGLPQADGTLSNAVSIYNQFVSEVIQVITHQELQGTGKWWTWISTEGFNTVIVETDTQMTQAAAIAYRISYLEAHLYDAVPQAIVSVYDNTQVLVDAITYIKTNNPTLTQWNAYLAALPWYDAYAVRWFLAMLARELANRNEVTLSDFTETEVLSRLKTWILNAPARRLAKIVFGM